MDLCISCKWFLFIFKGERFCIGCLILFIDFIRCGVSCSLEVKCVVIIVNCSGEVSINF